MAKFPDTRSKFWDTLKFPDKPPKFEIQQQLLKMIGQNFDINPCNFVKKCQYLNY